MSALGSCVWLCGTLAECDTEKMPSFSDVHGAGQPSRLILAKSQGLAGD
jgi:hypothetical protein